MVPMNAPHADVTMPAVHVQTSRMVFAHLALDLSILRFPMLPKINRYCYKIEAHDIL